MSGTDELVPKALGHDKDTIRPAGRNGILELAGLVSNVDKRIQITHVPGERLRERRAVAVHNGDFGRIGLVLRRLR